MTYWECMKLPINAFWVMHASINRILAEKDLRQLSIVGSQTESSMRARQDHLIIEMDGDQVKSLEISTERDEEGIADLKAMLVM